MNIAIDREGKILIARLQGRIEGANSIEFQKALEQAIGRDDTALILDMENLCYISSTGLRVVALMTKRTRDSGMKFALCALSHSIMNAITIIGFNKLVPIFDTWKEAHAAMSS